MLLELLRILTPPPSCWFPFAILASWTFYLAWKDSRKRG